MANKKSQSRVNLIGESEDETDSTDGSSFDGLSVKMGSTGSQKGRKKKKRNSGTDSSRPDGPRNDGPELNVMDGELKNYLDLQEVLAEVKLADQLEVPAIVVIGDQGAGKSTVLELLSQITLPRDNKMATRCPIHITMRKSAYSQIDISYTTGRGDEKSYTDLKPEEVQNYLRAAQERMVREGEEVCSDAIQLKVCGPSLPNLAIVDLPGLNYTDKGLTKEIKGMIQKWIEKPSTVIVVVFPCTGDITTTQAIQMARNVDPNFDRTMCVLTKPDLAVEKQVQSDIMHLASNKHESVKFKRGFVVVRGKGSDEIGATIQEARQKEKDFFENHEMFSELYRNKKAGTDNLVRIVSRIIHQIARRSLPLLVGEIRNMYRQAEAKKKSYPVIFEDDKSKYVELSKIVDGINTDFNALTLEEKDTRECENYHLHCSNNTAYDYFSHSVLTALIPDGGLYQEMREEYINHRGPEPRGFPRYSIYRNHVERKMRDVELIAMEALSKVEELVQKTLTAVLMSHANKFSLLRPLNDLTMSVFDTQRLACKQYLETIFEMEVKPFINDYNLKNVPLSLTSDKRKYQLLPTILTDICDPLSGVVTKKRKKRMFRGIKGILGFANPSAKPKIDSFFENVNEQLAAAGGSSVDSEDNQTDDENDGFYLGGDDESEKIPFKLPGGPPTQAPYSSKPIEDYVDEAVQKTIEMYYKYIYHCCCSMLDTIPKIIEYHMVISLKKKLLRALIENLNELAACMQEDPITAASRAEANEQVAKLERVLTRCRMFDNMGINPANN